MAELTIQRDPNLPRIPPEEELTDQLRWRLGHAEALVGLYRQAFGDINSLNNEVSTNANTANSHYSNISNPHSVNKTQVGLGNVTDDAQLKRAANDFNSFTEKTTLATDDILLIEDSASSYAKKKIKKTALEAWPVGSVFVSVVSTNPNTLLGYGTWSRISEGKVLVGQDANDSSFDTAEETGGNKTLVVANHTHYANHGHSNYVSGSSDPFKPVSEDGAVDVANTTILTTANGAISQSIMNPYFVVYIWKRTA